MVFCFSGTGNSRLAAKIIAEVCEDELVSINSLLNEKEQNSFNSEKPYIFVSPTYCWRLPPLVDNFIKSGSFGGNKKAYFVMTCGSETGNAVHFARATCETAGLDFSGLKSIVMPENYVAMFATPDIDTAEKIIAAAMPLINETAAKIKSGETLPDEKVTLLGKIYSSRLVNGTFFRLFVKAEDFYSTEKCVSCGKCAQLCPLGNITLADGEPVWGDNCTHCMACICGCPQEAIEYKRKSLGKPRHYIG